MPCTLKRHFLLMPPVWRINPDLVQKRTETYRGANEKAVLSVFAIGPMALGIGHLSLNI